LEDPSIKHWSVVNQILWYLQGTTTHGISYGQKNPWARPLNHWYCNVDWAGEVDGRKSTMGYCFLLNNGAISWHSKKQPTVALSSIEAKYMATTNATKEAIWIQQFCKDILGSTKPNQLQFCAHDNKSCIALTQNPKFHARTNHIEIHHHFVQEKVLSGDVEIKYCTTMEQYANFLTKGLPRPKHDLCKFNLGVLNIQE